MKMEKTVNSGQLKCFKCGNVGNKWVACMHKRREEVSVSPVTTTSGCRGSRTLTLWP